MYSTLSRQKAANIKKHEGYTDGSELEEFVHTSESEAVKYSIMKLTCSCNIVKLAKYFI